MVIFSEENSYCKNSARYFLGGANSQGERTFRGTYYWKKFCVLIDWVGGPDRKMFGSQSWHTNQAQQGPYAMTESQIFSCPAWSNSVNKYFIILPFVCFVRLENCEEVLINIQWKHVLGQSTFSVQLVPTHRALCTSTRKYVFYRIASVGQYNAVINHNLQLETHLINPNS